MAMEEEYPAKESAAVEETEDRPASAADYLISARALARKITDRGRRQAEEILRDANVRAEEILRDANARAGETVTRAEKQAEEILANAQRDAEALRAKTARELVPASPEDQEYTVRCVETCFEKLRRQHLDAIDLLNAQWQEFLCGLYAEEDTAPEEPGFTPAAEKIPADLSDRVSAIADAMGAFNGEE